MQRGELPVHRPAVLPHPRRPARRAAARRRLPGARPRTSGARSTASAARRRGRCSVAMNCGKAQPGQSAAVGHGCPSALFRQVNVLNTPRRRREAAGDRRAGAGRAGRAPGAPFSSRETSEAVLRWANSTMTTNGHTHRAGRGGGRAGGRRRWNGRRRGRLPARRSATPPRWTTWSRPPAALPATPARPATSRRSRSPPPTTRPGSTGRPRPRSACSPAWSSGLAGVLDCPQRHYGFASHELTHRLARHLHRRAQAVGAADGVDRAERQDPAARRIGVDGDVDRRLHRRRRRRARGGRHRPARLGTHGGSACPPGATRRCSRRRRCPTSCSMLAWSMGGRPAQEGRSALAGPDGPRVGERLTDRPLTLASDPAAPGPGVRAVRHRAALRRRDERLRQRRARRGASSGCATAWSPSWPTAAPKPPSSARRSPRPDDNLLLTGRCRRPRSTRWSPARDAACC